ncbi:MAG: F420-dependent methylenetetrahydromethanopterin dehydrogenase [Candidatus Heimdallarchaeota archaeon]
MKKVGILKLGNIASSVLLEMLLDERADRLDIDIKTVSSGAKLISESIDAAYKIFSKLNFDLIIVATPNASLKAPLKIINKIIDQKLPLIVLTDVMKKEVREELVEKNVGYLIIKSDAMIGARREFLDPIEMALFNSDLIKVLSIGGVFNLIYKKIDMVLEQLIADKKVKFPQKIVTSRKAVKFAGFSNPYAEAKARAALEIAENVAKVNTEGCFKINERFEYIPQVAMGHEMMRIAAKLADEAREIEKSLNQVRRCPHGYEGEIQDKRTLTEKPDSGYE